MILEVLVIGILLTFAFDFLNGFHDAANAIATIVATKVLTPVQAVGMAAVGNFVGMIFLTNAIAETIGTGIVEKSLFILDPSRPEAAALHATAMILGGVLGAIVWNIITWVWGLPTSSSHALIGGLVGSVVAAGAAGSVIVPSSQNILVFLLVTGAAFGAGAGTFTVVQRLRRETVSQGGVLIAGLLAGLLPSLFFGRLWLTGILKVVVFMVAAPLVGLIAAFGLTVLLLRLFRRTTPAKVNREFKRLQLLSSFFYSVTHGTNDAQKGMGIITLLLLVAAVGPPWGPIAGTFVVPFWVILGAHASISIGTLFGGWRIVRTMAQRVTALRPYQGFAAETGGGIALAGTAFAGIPVSTTHVISSAIMGVGATRRLSAVRWGVARRIVGAWVLTIPAAGGVGALCYLLLKVAFGV